MLTVILSLILLVVGCLFRVMSEKSGNSAFIYVIGVFFWIVAVLILIVAFLSAVSSIFSRLRFCFKLKKMAKSKGYTFNSVNNPILSFFRTYTGEDIVLTRREKVLRLKFFQGFISRWFIHPKDSKIAELKKRISLLGANVKSSIYGGVRYSGSKGRVISGDIIQINKRINLDFTKENSENIVIISPKCYELSCVEGNRKQIIGSGYQYGKKIIYFQKDFLNYFDRIEVKK